MIGNSYELFGTSTVFTITGEEDGYWVIAVSSPEGAQLGVTMTKADLAESVMEKTLIKQP